MVILCPDCVMLQIGNWKSKEDGKQTFFSRVCLFVANDDSLFYQGLFYQGLFYQGLFYQGLFYQGLFYGERFHKDFFTTLIQSVTLIVGLIQSVCIIQESIPPPI